MPLSSLTFAIDSDKRIVHVDDVANGIACGCTCPGCGERLIARQGSVMAHHFAHESGAECATACESALHLAAKAILLRERRIAVPGLTVTAEALDAQKRPHSAKASLSHATVSLDDVSEEVWMDGTRPDIVAKAGSKTLLIEIAVTHFAAEHKVRHLAAKGLPALEIDLSDIDRMANWTSISAAVIDQTSNKRWLFSPKAAGLLSKAELAARKLAEDADREAIAMQQRIDQSLEEQRSNLPEFQRELARFKEFIAPENQAALRAQIDSDGETEDAWLAVVQDLGAKWDDPPSYLNMPVPGELAFFADRRVWQAAIFLTFIRRNSKKTFTSGGVVRWVFTFYKRRVDFSILGMSKHLLPGTTWKLLNQNTSPVKHYLLALQEMGFIVNEGKQWRILKWG